MARTYDIGTRLNPHLSSWLLAVRALRSELSVPGAENEVVKERLSADTDYEPDSRTATVLSAIDKQRAVRPNSDFLIIQTVGYLPTLGPGLIQRGYEPGEKRWPTVVDLSRSAKNQP